jgi:hypothetical protein
MKNDAVLNAKAAAVPRIAHAKAELIGTQLHQQWTKLVSLPAPAADSLIWADLVQFVLRAARDVDQYDGTNQ